jgi:hypothetical protein
VCQRQEGEDDGLVSELDELLERVHVAAIVGVRELAPLWRAGRAGGVDDREEVLVGHVIEPALDLVLVYVLALLA